MCAFHEESEVKDRHFCSLFYDFIFFKLSFMLNAICQLSSQFLQVLEELNNLFSNDAVCKLYNVLLNKKA